MGEQIRGDTYADLLLSSFPKEFAFIRQMHHRHRSFTLEKIKQTDINFHIDDLKRRPHLLSLDVEQKWRPRPAAISATSATLLVTSIVIALGL